MAAVGSITQTTDATIPNANTKSVRKITLAWTSTAGGAVSGILTEKINGEIIRVVFIPSATAAPTANYDVTLLDQNAMDVLAGQGANLSATVTTHVCPTLPAKDATTTSTREIAIDDTLELVVAAAGASKEGQVIIYWR